ncbi:hypothetical protein SBRCBS47491_007659 [Sporothrix bragantina]|uniref:Uncharacterized protein n=1 Tax=Sporothrix bragantina TaxID=671064 RepID=A0ABP0CFS4_9PEZI
MTISDPGYGDKDKDKAKQEKREKREKQQPRRLLVLVKARHTEASTEAWDTPDELIARAVRFLQSNNTFPTLTVDDCRLMAVDRWSSRTFVVCDLFHDDYDFDTAHLADGRNNLPVTVLRRRQSDERPFSQDADAPGGPLENMVNTSLREAHESHGWRLRPPFKIDHKDGVYPVYHAPRALGRDRTFIPEADVTYSRNALPNGG